MCIAQALMHVHIVTTILLSVNGLAMLHDISSGHKPSDYIIIICTSIAAYAYSKYNSTEELIIVHFTSIISVHVTVV